MIIFAIGDYALTCSVKDTDLKRRKAEALYSAYKKGLEAGCFNSLFAAGRYVASQPAPCYYISARQASLILGRIQARISLVNLNPSQRRMAWRLWHNYRHYLQTHPDNTLSREKVLEILVDEPAPEFYISGDGARRVLRGEIKKIRKLKGW